MCIKMIQLLLLHFDFQSEYEAKKRDICKRQSALHIIREERHVRLIPPPRWVGRSCERVQSVSWVIDVLSFILGAESNDRAVCITLQKKKERDKNKNMLHMHSCAQKYASQHTDLFTHSST